MANTKEDQLSPTFGGIGIRGFLTTDLDTGKAIWRPYTSVLNTFNVNAGLVSTYDTTSKTWKWTPVGTVFQDMLDTNSSLKEQYSNDPNKVAKEFYTNTYKSIDKTINTNWTKYGVPLTAQRNDWVRGSGNAAQGSGKSDPIVGGQDPAKKEDPLSPISLTDISIKEKESEKIKISDSKLNIHVRYPETLDDYQDNIIFSVKKITGRQNINNAAGEEFKLGTNIFSTIIGTVTLPIQPSITDSNGVDWGGTSLNPIQAYAASKSMSVMTSGGDITGAAAQATNEAAKEFKDNMKEYQKAITLYFAQEAVGAQNLLSRVGGAIVNPNLELLFNGPTLRPFNFSFKLSPRSEKEAIIVKQIISFFKVGMSVRRSSSEVFLKTPCVFDIKYQTANKIHDSLNKIKTCALLACDVDYAPDGTYMTFNDDKKTMTSYQITLKFSELDPIYNDDYDDNHSIGY